MGISWNDNLKTGIYIIDEQHQKLFDLINNLDKFKGSKKDFTEVLLELQTYVATHFSTEEEYMRYLDYPDYEKHKACHDEFSNKYYSTLKKIFNEKNAINFGQEFVILLEDWITTHYTDEDVKMAAFIKNNLPNGLS